VGGIMTVLNRKGMEKSVKNYITELKQF